MKGLPTDLEMVILELLIAAPTKELYGLEMVRRDRRLGKTSIYVLLTRMIARAFVTAREEEEKRGRGPRRRLFAITGYGEQMFEARLAAERAARRQIARGGQLKPQGAL